MKKGQIKPGQRLEIRRIFDAPAGIPAAAADSVSASSAAAESVSASPAAAPSSDASADQPDWLVSQLLEDPEDADLMIAAPIQNFRVVNWPEGTQVEITYIEPLRGIWRVHGVIMNRGISDQVVFFKVRQNEKARRLQRRAHFRIDCTLEVSWQLASHESTDQSADTPENPSALTPAVPGNNTDKAAGKEIKNGAALPANNNRQLSAAEQRSFANQPGNALEHTLDTPLTAFTHDISGGGLQLISDIPVPVHTVLNLQLPAGGDQLDVKGQIIRCDEERTGRDKRYRIAVQFIELQQADQERLIQTIFDLQKKRLSASQS